MAFTETDLQVIEKAIKSGELSVQYRDRSVTYRPVDELLTVGDLIKKEVETSSEDRRIPRQQVASFSDG